MLIISTCLSFSITNGKEGENSVAESLRLIGTGGDETVNITSMSSSVTRLSPSSVEEH